MHPTKMQKHETKIRTSRNEFSGWCKVSVYKRNKPQIEQAQFAAASQKQVTSNTHFTQDPSLSCRLQFPIAVNRWCCTVGGIYWTSSTAFLTTSIATTLNQIKCLATEAVSATGMNSRHDHPASVTLPRLLTLTTLTPATRPDPVKVVTTAHAQSCCHQTYTQHIAIDELDNQKSTYSI